MNRVVFVLCVVLSARQAWAQNPALAPLADVGIEQRISAKLPLDVQLRDETGQAVFLKEYFGEKPVIFTLVYYECPMLCGLVLNGLFESLRTLRFSAGKDYEVVAVSFVPGETPALAAAKKEQLLKRYGLLESAAGWHFLTADAPAIRSLAEAAGFRYTWDERTVQWVHGSAIMIVTPDGRLSRYFFGVEYPPRDVRLALVEASEGRIGNIIDKALLYCFHYDPLTGQYGFAIMSAIRIAGVATVITLGIFITMMLRRERLQRSAAGSVGSGTGGGLL
jgi:protein SCO1/2